MGTKKLLREPLVHFVLLGALVFAVHTAIGRFASDEHRIVLTPSLRAELEREFIRRTGHPPAPEDSHRLVADWASEEVLYLEGMRLGLDQGDLVVRGRVISKMKSVIEGLVIVRAPTDADLEAWLAANRARYETPIRIDLEQAFASNERGFAHERAAKLLEKAAAGGSLAGLGDPFASGTRHEGRSLEYLSRTFGKGFAAALSEAAVGGWLLVQSDHGWHAVHVTRRVGGETPTVEGLRPKLARDWTNAEKLKLAASKTDELVASYRIEQKR